MKPYALILNVIRFAYKFAFYLIFVSVVVIVLFRFGEKMRGTTTTVNHLVVNLTSIKELNDLIVARYVVGRRQIVVFDDNGTPDEEDTTKVSEILLRAYTFPFGELYYLLVDQSKYIDFVGVMNIDAVIPMNSVEIKPMENFKGVVINIPEILIKRGNLDATRSFIWDEKNPPRNARQIVANRSETEVLKELGKYMKYEDIKRETETFFTSFYQNLGFSKVSVILPDKWTVDQSGLSTDPVADKIKTLAQKYKVDLENTEWHIDPEIPSTKMENFCKKSEYKNLSNEDPAMLFFDTHGSGKTGLIVTPKGLYWRNGYLQWWKDTKKSFLSLDEFRNTHLWIGKDSSKLILSADSKDKTVDETVFFDCRDEDKVEKVLGFLTDLQEALKNPNTVEQNEVAAPAVQDSASENKLASDQEGE